MKSLKTQNVINKILFKAQTACMLTKKLITRLINVSLHFKLNILLFKSDSNQIKFS